MEIPNAAVGNICNAADVAAALKKQRGSENAWLPIGITEVAHYTWQCSLLVAVPTNALLQRCDRLHEILAVTQKRVYSILHSLSDHGAIWHPPSPTFDELGQTVSVLAHKAAAHLSQVMPKFHGETCSLSQYPQHSPPHACDIHIRVSHCDDAQPTSLLFVVTKQQLCVMATEWEW